MGDIYDNDFILNRVYPPPPPHGRFFGKVEQSEFVSIVYTVGIIIACIDHGHVLPDQPTLASSLTTAAVAQAVQQPLLSIVIAKLIFLPLPLTFLRWVCLANVDVKNGGTKTSDSFYDPRLDRGFPPRRLI